MGATKLFKPYNISADRKRAKLTLTKTGAGVYFIYAKNWLGERVLVYIGYSGVDVRRTMIRHFQRWTDKRHPETKRVQRIERVTYWHKKITHEEINKEYSCRVIFCHSAQQAERLERYLILKFKPRDNSLKLALETEREAEKAKKEYEKLNITAEADALDDLPF